MILKLKYFGMIAEAVGKEEESYNFSATSVDDLKIALKNNYSKLSNMNYKVAVNQSIAESNMLLKENDEVALLPPFAGG